MRLVLRGHQPSCCRASGTRGLQSAAQLSLLQLALQARDGCTEPQPWPGSRSYQQAERLETRPAGAACTSRLPHGAMSFSTDKLRSILNPSTASSTSSSSSSSAAITISHINNVNASPPPPSPLLDSLLRTYELPIDSSALEQIELCVDASLHCLQAGSRRKAAFFLIQAAGLYQELHQYAACTTLLQAIGQVYKLELAGRAQSLADAGGSAKQLSAERRYERGESDEPWVVLQRSILEHLIYAAHKSNSQLATIQQPSQPQ